MKKSTDYRLIDGRVVRVTPNFGAYPCYGVPEEWLNVPQCRAESFAEAREKLGIKLPVALESPRINDHEKPMVVSDE